MVEIATWCIDDYFNGGYCFVSYKEKIMLPHTMVANEAFGLFVIEKPEDTFSVM